MSAFRAARAALWIAGLAIPLGAGGCSRPAAGRAGEGPPRGDVREDAGVERADAAASPATAAADAGASSHAARWRTRLVDGGLVIEEVTDAADAGALVDGRDPGGDVVGGVGDVGDVEALAADPGAQDAGVTVAQCKDARAALSAALSAPAWATRVPEDPAVLDAVCAALAVCAHAGVEIAKLVDGLERVARVDPARADAWGLRMIAARPHPELYAQVTLARDRTDDVRGAREILAVGLDRYPRSASLLALDARLRRQREVEAGFDKKRNTRFVVRFEGDARQDLADVTLAHLDQAWRTIGDALDVHPERPFTVIIYTGDQMAQARDGPDWSGAMFDGKIRVKDVERAARRGGLEDTLFHEYTHAVVHTLPSAVPAWFNEGLATRLEPGANDVLELQPLLPIAADALPPLASLAGSFSSKRAWQDAKVAYACAFDLVTMLSEMRGARSFASVFAQMNGGASFGAALESVYGVSEALLERKWRERHEERLAARAGR